MSSKVCSHRRSRDVRSMAANRAECVAKLLAVLRTRNYRIQLNGVFEPTLRACARPWINIARSGRAKIVLQHNPPGERP